MKIAARTEDVEVHETIPLPEAYNKLQRRTLLIRHLSLLFQRVLNMAAIEKDRAGTVEALDIGEGEIRLQVTFSRRHLDDILEQREHSGLDG